MCIRQHYDLFGSLTPGVMQFLVVLSNQIISASVIPLAGLCRFKPGNACPSIDMSPCVPCSSISAVLGGGMSTLLAMKLTIAGHRSCKTCVGRGSREIMTERTDVSRCPDRAFLLLCMACSPFEYRLPTLVCSACSCCSVGNTARDSCKVYESASNNWLAQPLDPHSLIPAS